MLIKKEFIQQHLQELVQIWLKTNIQAHHFIPKQYWKQNVAFVTESLPQATLFCKGENPIQGFLGISDGYIEGLFVMKEFQQNGVGKALIEEAKSCFDNLSLSVYAKNQKAIAFYQKMGFIIEQETIQQQTNEKEYFMTWAAN